MLPILQRRPQIFAVCPPRAAVSHRRGRRIGLSQRISPRRKIAPFLLRLTFRPSDGSRRHRPYTPFTYFGCGRVVYDCPQDFEGARLDRMMIEARLARLRLLLLATPPR